jgi:fructose-1,6-bisphosphatase II
VSSDNVFFAATGVTNGEFLRGVNFRGDEKAVTHSVIMRSKTGSVRYMTAVHDLARLREISSLTVD